jgi:adenosylhomocysteine nucleosidase
MTLAILSALAEEQHGLVDAAGHAMPAPCRARFLAGLAAGHEVVCALSGIGKVAAATTTAALIERFGVRGILFTGVAGGIGADVNVGDVVIARTFLQHDMDASPIFPRWQLPGYGCSTGLRRGGDGPTGAGLPTLALAPASWLHMLSLASSGGLVASGDQFVSSRQASAAPEPIWRQPATPCWLWNGGRRGPDLPGLRHAVCRDTNHLGPGGRQRPCGFFGFRAHVASRYAQRVVLDFLRQTPAKKQAVC